MHDMLANRMTVYLDIPVSNVMLVKVAQSLQDWQNHGRNDTLWQSLQT